MMQWKDERLKSRLEGMPGFLGSVLEVLLVQIFTDGPVGWAPVGEKDLVLERPVAWNWSVQIVDDTGALVVHGRMDEREDARLAAMQALSCVAVRLHEEAVALNTACHAMPPTHSYVPSSPQALANLAQIRDLVDAAFNT